MPTQEESNFLEKKIDDTSEELHKHIRIVQKTIDKLDNKVTRHIEDFKTHEEIENRKYDEYYNAHQINTRAIDHLVQQLQKQSDDTQGLIELWKNTMGLINGIQKIRNFVIWSSATIIAISGVYSVLHNLGIL